MQYLLWHCVENAAHARPDHPAVRFDGQTLTYQALAEQTARLAGVLREAGVRRGDRVGVMMTKDLATLSVVHGILRAGAAFVPIDPAAPANRVRFILRDCEVRVLVTQTDRHRVLTQVLSEATPVEVAIGLDDTNALPIRCIAWSDIANAELGGREVKATQLDLAYIMYTSGSTGNPKGLMHTHYSGLSYARLSAATYEVSADDRISGFAPLHVDQCTFACFTAPLASATAVMVSDAHTAFPVDLAKLIAAERISIWYSVPLALIQLAERGELNNVDHRSLRWVTYGGEPFPTKHLRTLMEHWPQARFSNVYGPAEVNQCTYYHFGAADLGTQLSVPIGDVWADTDALILDDADQDVALGETGELLIRSPTMMHGYWRRPDLDAHAFFDRQVMPNFWERYYRTGDLVRRCEDGLLEFLGRKDRQVKSRGYRVELDEVETVLCGHEAVAESAALAIGDSPDDRRIMAAVLLRDGADASVTSIARQAARSLPAYAVPEEIVVMDSFPRTGGGKIDRRALAHTLVATRDT